MQTDLLLTKTRPASAASRMRALRNKFEGIDETPAPPPKKDRVISTVDAPAPTLAPEAKAARIKSVERAHAQSEVRSTARYVPRITSADSDEVRHLKRAIHAKELEIMDMTAKISSLADRLDRVVDIFAASTVEVAVEEALPKPAEDRVKAFQTEGTPKVHLSPKAQQSEARSNDISSGGTSLAAILAAARGGEPRVKSERPKYAKLLRDMK